MEVKFEILFQTRSTTEIESFLKILEDEAVRISDDPKLKTTQIIKRLSQSVIIGDWKEVLKICKEDWGVLNIPITQSKDTVLHLAAYNKQEDIFEQLPEDDDGVISALLKENTEGNTPLHIAALVGSVRMCRNIIDRTDSETRLGSRSRNKEGETPLFKAALHDKKEAFLYFHSLCGPGVGYKHYCTRNDGETILHCAISKEYFGEHFHA
ncbi:nuclear factor nf-kappa-b p105 subunit [Fagus crenata]